MINQAESWLCMCWHQVWQFLVLCADILLSCCVCCVQVRFTGDQGAITSMVSVEGEVVDLTATVTVTDAIESWLNHLTAGMRATLQQLVLGVDKMTAPFQQASSQVLGLFHALRFTTR